jgi:hypothetical protein
MKTVSSKDHSFKECATVFTFLKRHSRLGRMECIFFMCQQGTYSSFCVHNLTKTKEHYTRAVVHEVELPVKER